MFLRCRTTAACFVCHPSGFYTAGTIPTALLGACVMIDDGIVGKNGGKFGVWMELLRRHHTHICAAATYLRYQECREIQHLVPRLILLLIVIASMVFTIGAKRIEHTTSARLKRGSMVVGSNSWHHILSWWRLCLPWSMLPAPPGPNQTTRVHFCVPFSPG